MPPGCVFTADLSNNAGCGDTARASFLRNQKISVNPLNLLNLWSKKSPGVLPPGDKNIFTLVRNYSFADLTVLMITAATLYGSAAELGRRSSR